MYLKLSPVTKFCLVAEPYLGHPCFAAVAIAGWTALVFKLYRWQPVGRDLDQADTQAKLELALAMHVGLNLLILGMGIVVILPFSKLLGCM